MVVTTAVTASDSSVCPIGEFASFYLVEQVGPVAGKAAEGVGLDVAPFGIGKGYIVTFVFFRRPPVFPPPVGDEFGETAVSFPDAASTVIRRKPSVSIGQQMSTSFRRSSARVRQNPTHVDTASTNIDTSSTRTEGV